MTKTSRVAHFFSAKAWLPVLLAGLPLAVSADVTPQQKPPVTRVVIQPAPAARFQQTVQQQQLRTQLQNSQMRQQLHQDVSDQSRSVLSDHPASQTQMDQASQAQQNRERAAQEALIEQKQTTLPRVVPTHRAKDGYDGGR